MLFKEAALMQSDLTALWLSGDDFVNHFAAGRLVVSRVAGR